MYPKKELAQFIVAAHHKYKIDTVVISPGSRNAPLIIGFSNHPDIETISIVDERCAGFFALGIAQQKQKPVSVLCTSGSALLNYYSAITEAFYSNIPLVVISADRPKKYIDIGDGQTIRQENVFENHILFSANLNEEFNHKNFQIINTALATSILKKGPVHINVPFDEPLYETVASLHSFNFYKFSDKTFEKSYINYKNLSKIWNDSDKKMILVGSNYPNSDLQKVIDKLIEDDSVLLLIETTSNLNHKNAINSIDQLILSLSESEIKKFQPDVLITFGGMIVSKKIKQLLRKHPPKHHWNIDEKKSTNTFFCLSEFIHAKPSDFFSKFISYIKIKDSKYQSLWLKIRDEKRAKHLEFIKKVEHSDFKVFHQVLESIPSDCHLQISNSAVIRYSQLFSICKTIKVFCNRGTSGIEGSTSTAIGAAYASKKQTVFITGDLSFFYDSNALWNEKIPKNFTIIIINNFGGGIFKIISGPMSINSVKYFETPHSFTAEHLCKMHGFRYYKANSTQNLEDKLKGFYLKKDKPKVLEIFTPSSKNAFVLKQYFKYIS